MMKRRDLPVALAGVASAAAGAAANAATRPRRNTLMHVGADYHYMAGAEPTGAKNLEFNLRLGVKHLTAHVGKMSPEGAWDFDELRRMRDNCDKYGVTLEALRLDAEYIQMPPGDARDRRLESIAGNIEKASKVGVKVITYLWTLIPLRRNGQRPGRGGASYVTFRLEDDWRSLPVRKAGRVSADDYWERITYFLKRVIPVAKQYDVRMACHPYDPTGLPLGYQGVENWDSPSVFAGIKRYEAVVESPYNGFQLCLGAVAEGLKSPATEVMPIVKYLGERGKIYSVHMRNIQGGLNDFAEVYPDEGVLNLHKIMRVLRDTQFAYSICADHMPSHPDDPGKLHAFSFGNGYLKALIDSVNSEVD